MKKTIALGAIAASTALVLAACGQAPSDSEESGGSASGEQSGSANGGDIKACMVSDSGGFDDKSFNQSGHDGLMRAKSELGVQTDQAESTSDADFVPNINNMVQGGCDVIIGVGFLMKDAMLDAARQNPDVKFALVDDTFASDEGDVPENSRGLVFNTAEASFLAGYAAAGMSQSGKVGTYVGMNIPSTAIFADGFSDGVDEYNKEKGTNVELLGWNKAQQDGMVVGGFEDVSKGKQFTEQLVQQGADIVMPVAGPVGTGTLQAMRETPNGAVVWVDADGFETQPEYGDIILTSVMKDIGNAVFDTIQSVVDGTFDSANYVGTLENGGVSIAPWHDFEDKVPQDLKDAVDQLQQKIISGEVKVETTNAPTS